MSGTGKGVFHNWDAEHIFENVNDNVLSKLQTGGPTEIFQALMVNAEFKQQFADEVQRLMFNGGILTPQVVGSLFRNGQVISTWPSSANQRDGEKSNCQ